MTYNPHWYRLNIDLDPQGHPVGLSYELRTDRLVSAIHVLEPPGPFDDPYDALTVILSSLRGRYGVQLKLDLPDPLADS